MRQKRVSGALNLADRMAQAPRIEDSRGSAVETSALHGGLWSASRSGRTVSGKADSLEQEDQGVPAQEPPCLRLEVFTKWSVPTCNCSLPGG